LIAGGGVLRSSNAGVSVIIIPDSAHHLDLRADHKDDTKNVKWARRYYVDKFKEWIDTY
jgi:lysosomal Pro-X carboxypeptidase